MAEYEFIDFKAPTKENPYKDVVQALADLNNPEKGYPLTIDVNEMNKEVFKFQRAANEINRTARLRQTITDDVVEEGVDEDGNPVKSGNVTVIFTITKMHKGRRGPRKVVNPEEENTDSGNTENSEADNTENSEGDNTESNTDSENSSSGRGRRR